MSTDHKYDADNNQN